MTLRQKLLEPAPRHRTGALTGTTDAVIAAGCLVGGVVEIVVRGGWFGLLLILASFVVARDAYLKYKVGSWP